MHSKEKNNKKFRRSFSGTNGEEFNLESYLWESANILRGNVDASDFKAYIFPLLFYKRISDVYDEEYEKALDESKGDVEYALSEVNHRFQIPEGSHWNDIRKINKNIGQQLQKFLRNIEQANPETLFGIFGDTNWGNKEKLTDELMVNLIEHFSKIDLSNSKIEPDILGRSYEYLIKRFADLTNRKAGEFYTPRKIVELMTKILDPKENESIYDPACGTAGMLLESAEHVKRQKQDFRRLKLYGEEINLNTSAIARINLFLHGYDDFKIRRGDTLREPSFHESDNVLKFDCVIANPPFSLKDWGYDVWKNDPFGRTKYGLPPKAYGDFAWVLHMISSMKKNSGRVAVVISSAALSRNSEKSIREKLIQNDLFEAIIQLGPDLFYGTSISPSILIFKEKKDTSDKNRILMINTSNFYEKDRSQNFLRDSDITKIIEIYQKRQELPNISKHVTVEEIVKNNFDMNILNYVEQIDADIILPVNTAFTNMKESYLNFEKSELKLQRLLKNYQIGSETS